MTEPTPIQVNPIVVGTDGSDHSDAAIRWAADVAAAYGAALTVMHARPNADGVARVIAEPVATGVLGKAVQMVHDRQPDLTVEALYMPDSPVGSLLAMAEVADLLVLGSRGNGGFRGLLVGSTTMNVTPYVECPVVVVHPATEEVQEPEAGEGNPGQVVLGYDGSSSANRAAAFAFRHAASIGCGVVVVTVEAQRSDPESAELDPTDEVPGSDIGAFNAPILLIAEAFPGVPVSFIAAIGRPAEVLIDHARGAKLLVVGNRGRGGFAKLVMGSVSQKVVIHATSPVAILHSGVTPESASGATGS